MSLKSSAGASRLVTALLLGLAEGGSEALPELDTSALCAALPGPPVEWLRRHGLLALYGYRQAGSRERGGAHPEAMHAYRSGQWLAVQADDQLVEIDQEFSARKLPLLVLKGPVFAHGYFPSPATRMYGDLDLLVSTEQLAEAEAVLVSQGYQLLSSDQYADRQFYLENHNHWVFQRGKDRPVELHWALTPPDSPVQFPTADLFARSRAFPSDQFSARILSVEDELVSLAAHVTKHQFQIPLRQFMDLAFFLRKHPDLDWDLAWERAEQSGAAVDLALTLRVGIDLGVVELPTAISEQASALAGDAATWGPLAQYVMEWPFLNAPEGLVALLAGKQESAGPAKRQPVSPIAPRSRTFKDLKRGVEALARYTLSGSERKRLVKTAAAIRARFKNRDAW